MTINWIKACLGTDIKDNIQSFTSILTWICDKIIISCDVHCNVIFGWHVPRVQPYYTSYNANIVRYETKWSHVFFTFVSAIFNKYLYLHSKIKCIYKEATAITINFIWLLWISMNEVTYNTNMYPCFSFKYYFSL